MSDGTSKHDFGEVFRRRSHEEQQSRAEDESAFRDAAGGFDFGGTQFGGGFTINQTFGQNAYDKDTQTEKLASDTVSATEIRRIRAVYQRPQNYVSAVKVLENAHLLIMRGATGVGKRATAIKLALDVVDNEPVTLNDVAPDIDLLNTLQVLAAKEVYIVDGLLGIEAKKVKTHDWRILASRMQSAESYLLVCIDSRVRLPGDLPPDYVSIVTPPTTAARIIVKEHLLHFNAESGQRLEETIIDGCLDDDVVTATLNEEQLLPGPAARLAFALWQYLVGDCSLVEALATFRDSADTAVVTWFDEFGIDNSRRTPTVEIEERALRIALVILHGLDYTTFRQALSDLTQRLFDHFGVTKAAQSTDAHTDIVKSRNQEEYPVVRLPFGVDAPAGSPLQRADAELRMVQRASYIDEQRKLRVVQLKNPSLRPALLKLLLDDDRYVGLLEVALLWMRELGRAENPAIRYRAADAVSLMALHDFELVRDRILRKWMADNTRSGRAALSYVFGRLVWDDDSVDTIMTYLAHWRASTDDSVKWSALRAYSRVGLRYPGQAMAGWRFIVEHLWYRIDIPLDDYLVMTFENPNHDAMLASLLDAMISLFRQALNWPGNRLRIYMALLYALRQWILDDEEQDSRTQFGSLIFLFLMTIRIPLPDPDEVIETAPPALLEMSGIAPSDSSFADDLIWLLRRTANNRKATKLLFDILEDWVSFVDATRKYKPRLRSILEQWIAGADVHPREKNRICRHLRSWSRRSRNPLPTAGELMDELGLECEVVTRR